MSNIEQTVDIAMARMMIDYYIDADTPVFTWGPPGVGKSDIIKQAAKDRKWGLIDFRAVLRDPVDLRGIPMTNPKTKTTVWCVPEELPNEDRHGKRGIFFMDELNAANQQVQAACFGLVLDRKLGDYVMPKGWVIVAAGNRQSDRSAAQRMPRALANRFAHIEVEANPDVWVRDYASTHCHPMLSAFIRFRKELIHNMDVDGGGDERMFPTPRAWAQVSKFVDSPDSVRYPLVRGLVGEAAAAEFEGFYKTWRELPDLDEIIKNPKRTPVPEEPSALYAVSAALARKATRDNMTSIVTYAERLGREYEIVTVMDATKREPTLTKTKAYIGFIERNKEIQIGSIG